MPSVSETLRVAAPPERLWALLADPRRRPQWADGVDEVFYVSEGPLREGTVYRERVRHARGRAVADWRVAKCEPPGLQVHRGATPDADLTLRHRLDPDGEGTRWRLDVDARLLSRFGWLREVLGGRRRLRGWTRARMERVKALVEAEGRSSPEGASHGATGRAGR